MGDSQVILRQVLRKYRTRDPKLISYQRLVDKMMKKFRRIVFVHVPRSKNILEDSLTSLSSSYSFPFHQEQETITLQRLHMLAIKDPWFAKTTEKVKEPNEDTNTGTLMTVSLLDFDEEPEEELPWFHYIEAYLQDRTYPELATPDQRRSLRRMANKYIIVGSTLFR